LKGKICNILCFFAFALVTIGSQAQESVKTHEGVQIGGIKQWIGVKGADDTKPLLLFLHGGPGFSSRNYAKKFIKYLQKDFIIAQWDQRETGITSHWGPYSDSLTVDIFHKDTEEVVSYLLKKFTKEKIFLVGFSWGGFLGLHFANEHPELLHAYISVSSMIHPDESEQLTLALLQEKATISGDIAATDEISKISIPFNSWEELYFQRKWTVHFLDKKKFNPNQKKVFEQWSEKWWPIFIEASKVDYAETVPAIHCPIYFFISKNDFVANYLVAENYFNSLHANQKQIIWFEQSTHEIPTDEPKKFGEELINIVRQMDAAKTEQK
jgi:pimeloyl-ACP methyl ester carboxylesterase